jgi:oxalate decarboxylase/phosphoglucose isomerase-like protein (cupin superfamily)
MAISDMATIGLLEASAVAVSRVTIKPGGLQEMHWHPNADEGPLILDRLLRFEEVLLSDWSAHVQTTWWPRL